MHGSAGSAYSSRFVVCGASAVLLCRWQHVVASNFTIDAVAAHADLCGLLQGEWCLTRGTAQIHVGGTVKAGAVLVASTSHLVAHTQTGPASLKHAVAVATGTKSTSEMGMVSALVLFGLQAVVQLIGEQPDTVSLGGLVELHRNAEENLEVR